jgi:hypothetical protein
MMISASNNSEMTEQNLEALQSLHDHLVAMSLEDGIPTATFSFETLDELMETVEAALCEQLACLAWCHDDQE